MWMQLARQQVLVIACVALTACSSSSTGPDLEIPVLVSGPEVSNPAPIGAPLTVTFITYSMGCGYEPDHVDVKVNGMVADITPWDRPPAGAFAECPLTYDQRIATVTFPAGSSPGTGSVVIHSRDPKGATVMTTKLLTLTN
jgi:hypothetical protein